jgi:acyl carrier protein
VPLDRAASTDRKEPATVADNILEELAAILQEVADVNPEDVTPEKSFVDDLDVDSLSMVEVAMAVEEKFNAKIPDDKLSELKTVGDAISYIEQHGQN